MCGDLSIWLHQTCWMMLCVMVAYGFVDFDLFFLFGYIRMGEIFCFSWFFQRWQYKAVVADATAAAVAVFGKKNCNLGMNRDLLLLFIMPFGIV
ncbi:MAG: hypothetical protein HS129_11350 [Leptospiraceae bacterium]|nr:hypothetical protein [Leptospiraceae bacterium]